MLDGLATEALFHGEGGKAIRRIPQTIRSVALRKLDMLNAARELGNLRARPGNRLEALDTTNLFRATERCLRALGALTFKKVTRASEIAGALFFERGAGGEN